MTLKRLLLCHCSNRIEINRQTAEIEKWYEFESGD